MSVDPQAPLEEPTPEPPRLRVVDTQTGEFLDTDACPGCVERDKRVERLLIGADDLEKEIGRLVRANGALTRERHEKLNLHAKAEQAKRVYRKHRDALHPKAQEEPPDDVLALILARMKGAPKKGFTEEQCLMAVQGAIDDAYVDDKGKRHDGIELIFRTTGKVWDFIGRAERAAAERRRTMPLGTQILDVLRAANRVDVKRSTETRVHADCPSCGGGLWLDVRSGTTICRGSCEQEAVDAALVKVAAAHGLPLGGQS